MALSAKSIIECQCSGTQKRSLRFSTLQHYGLFYVILLVTYIPTLSWYCKRLGDGSDEPLGLLALTALFLFGVLQQPSKLTATHLNSLVVTSYCYFFVRYLGLPEMIPASIVAISCASVVSFLRSKKIFEPGIWMLSLLSLPIISSLQFYLGYPIRAIAAEVLALILRSGGFAVTAYGTALEYQQKLILIDAPCSGLKMWWSTLFMTGLLASYLRMSTHTTLVLFSVSSWLAFLANVGRLFVLFFADSGILQLGEMVHTLVGLASFTFLALTVLCICKIFSGRTLQPSVVSISNAQFSAALPSHRLFCYQILLCVFSLVLSHYSTQTSHSLPASINIAWPQTWEGAPLQEQALTQRDLNFIKNFPGQVKRFQADNQEILVRYVEQPTRKLHSSWDCFRAIGYRVSPDAHRRNANSKLSNCARAIRHDSQLQICEYIIDAQGRTFIDVSNWYWAATFGSSPGPWLAYTIAQPLVTAANDNHN